MGERSEYTIPFRTLKTGKHHFHFDIENAFFDDFESSEVKQGEILARIDLEKHSQFLEMRFYLSGYVMVPCDRCLDLFPLEIKHQAVLYVRFGEETHELTDEVLILAADENEIEVKQHLYEFIHLAIPFQRIHPQTKGQPGCNPRMTEMLKAHTSAGKNQGTTDPRWDKLKEIG